MLTLITGSSASGKSFLAETIAINQQKGSLFYIATMKCYDLESKERVKKHRNMRKEKHFITIEQPRNIGVIEPFLNGTYLLECMSNLIANEMYQEEIIEEEVEGELLIVEKESLIIEKDDKLLQKIMLEIKSLHENSDNLIIVTNEVFSDITLQDKFCLEYLETLAYINCEIAKLADVVIESVIGVPIYFKGDRYDYI